MQKPADEHINMNLEMDTEYDRLLLKIKQKCQIASINHQQNTTTAISTFMAVKNAS